ncbi:hypothetical protein ACJJTC_015822 [Scirpophaga incertulas]
MWLNLMIIIDAAFAYYLSRIEQCVIITGVNSDLLGDHATLREEVFWLVATIPNVAANPALMVPSLIEYLSGVPAIGRGWCRLDELPQVTTATYQLVHPAGKKTPPVIETINGLINIAPLCKLNPLCKSQGVRRGRWGVLNGYRRGALPPAWSSILQGHSGYLQDNPYRNNLPFSARRLQPGRWRACPTPRSDEVHLQPHLTSLESVPQHSHRRLVLPLLQPDDCSLAWPAPALRRAAAEVTCSRTHRLASSTAPPPPGPTTSSAPTTAAWRWRCACPTPRCCTRCTCSRTSPAWPVSTAHTHTAACSYHFFSADDCSLALALRLPYAALLHEVHLQPHLTSLASQYRTHSHRRLLLPLLQRRRLQPGAGAAPALRRAAARGAPAAAPHQPGQSVPHTLTPPPAPTTSSAPTTAAWRWRCACPTPRCCTRCTCSRTSPAWPVSTAHTHTAACSYHFFSADDCSLALALRLPYAALLHEVHLQPHLTSLASQYRTHSHRRLLLPLLQRRRLQPGAGAAPALRRAAARGAPAAAPHQPGQSVPHTLTPPPAPTTSSAPTTAAWRWRCACPTPRCCTRCTCSRTSPAWPVSTAHTHTAACSYHFFSADDCSLALALRLPYAALLHEVHLQPHLTSLASQYRTHSHRRLLLPLLQRRRLQPGAGAAPALRRAAARGAPAAAPHQPGQSVPHTLTPPPAPTTSSAPTTAVWRWRCACPTPRCCTRCTCSRTSPAWPVSTAHTHTAACSYHFFSADDCSLALALRLPYAALLHEVHLQPHLTSLASQYRTHSHRRLLLPLLQRRRLQPGAGAAPALRRAAARGAPAAAPHQPGQSVPHTLTPPPAPTTSSAPTTAAWRWRCACPTPRCCTRCTCSRTSPAWPVSTAHTHTAACSYHFFSADDCSLALALRLPYAALLHEVHLQPHLTSLASQYRTHSHRPPAPTTSSAPTTAAWRWRCACPTPRCCTRCTCSRTSPAWPVSTAHTHTAACSYHFFSADDCSLALALRLPYAAPMLHEVHLQLEYSFFTKEVQMLFVVHCLPFNEEVHSRVSVQRVRVSAACPGAVGVEAGCGGAIAPLGPPQNTAGMTYIRLALARPVVVSVVQLRLFRPRDSANMGLLQLRLLVAPAFAALPNVPAPAPPPAAHHLAAPHPINTNNNWASVVSSCTRARLPLVRWSGVTGAAALEALCACVVRGGAPAHHAARALLAAAHQVPAVRPRLMRALLHMDEQAHAHEFQMSSSGSGGYSMSAVCLLVRQVCQRSAAGSVLWNLKEQPTLDILEELIADDLFDLVYAWVNNVPETSLLKKALDAILCSMCYIRPELYKKILDHMEIPMDQDERVKQCYKPWHWRTSSVVGVLAKMMVTGCVVAVRQHGGPDGRPQEFCEARLEMIKQQLKFEDDVTMMDIETDISETKTDASTMSIGSACEVVSFLHEISAERRVKAWLGADGAGFWRPLLALLCHPRPAATTWQEGAQYAELEESTIRLFAELIVCHPENQVLFAHTLHKVLESLPDGEGISGFTRALILRLVVSSERVRVVMSWGVVGETRALPPHPAACGPAVALPLAATVRTLLLDHRPPREYCSPAHLPTCPLAVTPVEAVSGLWSSSLTNPVSSLYGGTGSARSGGSAGGSGSGSSSGNSAGGVMRSASDTALLPVTESWELSLAAASASKDKRIKDVKNTTLKQQAAKKRQLKPANESPALTADDVLESSIRVQVVGLEGLIPGHTTLATLVRAAPPTYGAHLSLTLHLANGAAVRRAAWGCRRTRWPRWGCCSSCRATPPRCWPRGARAVHLLRLLLGVARDEDGKSIPVSGGSGGSGGEWSLGTLPFRVLARLLEEGAEGGAVAAPLQGGAGEELRRALLALGAVRLVLRCLAVFTHHPTSPNGQGSNGSGPGAGKEDKGQLYWAKGTGFGTGSTQQSWNVEQALVRQRTEEEHVTVLLQAVCQIAASEEAVTCVSQVLASYMNPGEKWPPEESAAEEGARPEDADADEPHALPLQFVQLVARSCLVPAICCYLRNDSGTSGVARDAARGRRRGRAARAAAAVRAARGAQLPGTRHLLLPAQRLGYVWGRTGCGPRTPTRTSRTRCRCSSCSSWRAAAWCPPSAATCATTRVRLGSHGMRPEDADADEPHALPLQFVQLVARICLVPAICCNLRNDSGTSVYVWGPTGRGQPCTAQVDLTDPIITGTLIENL